MAMLFPGVHGGSSSETPTISDKSPVDDLYDLSAAFEADDTGVCGDVTSHFCDACDSGTGITKV